MRNNADKQNKKKKNFFLVKTCVIMAAIKGFYF